MGGWLCTHVSEVASKRNKSRRSRKVALAKWKSWKHQKRMALASSICIRILCSWCWFFCAWLWVDGWFRSIINTCCFNVWHQGTAWAHVDFQLFTEGSKVKRKKVDKSLWQQVLSSNVIKCPRNCLMSPQARMHYGHPDIMNKVPNSGVLVIYQAPKTLGRNT